MRTRLYKNWWLLLFKGILTLLLGIFLLFNPEATARLFSVIVGILIGVSGLFLISGSVSHMRANYEWTWWLLEGLVDLLVGILMIFNPLQAASVIIILLAIWVIIMGFIQIITSINIQYYMTGNLILVFGGAVALVFGILLLLNPDKGLKGIILLFGIFAIFYGISQVYVSTLLRKIVIDEIGEVEDVYL